MMSMPRHRGGVGLICTYAQVEGEEVGRKQRCE